MFITGVLKFPLWDKRAMGQPPYGICEQVGQVGIRPGIAKRLEHASTHGLSKLQIVHQARALSVVMGTAA